MYAIQGLWSAAELAVPVAFVIINNDGYRALDEFAAHFGLGTAPGTRLAHLDFCALARAQGVEAVRVSLVRGARCGAAPGVRGHATAAPRGVRRALAGGRWCLVPRARSRRGRTSIVELRSLLQPRIGCRVVLNPHGGSGLAHELVHFLARLPRHGAIEVEGWHAVERALLGQVVQVTLQQQGSEAGQPQEQHLMPRGMARCGLDDHGAVAEYVVVLIVEGDAPGVLEPLVGLRASGSHVRQR